MPYVYPLKKEMPKFSKYKARRSVRKAYKKAGFGKPGKGRFTKRKTFKKRSSKFKRPVKSLTGISNSYLSAGGRRHKAHSTCFKIPLQQYLRSANGEVHTAGGTNQQCATTVSMALSYTDASDIISASQSIINTITGNGYGSTLTTQIYLESCKIDSRITNSSVSPVEAEILYMVPRRTTSTLIYAEWGNAIAEAQQNKYDSAIVQNTMDQSPFDYSLFRTQWKLVKKRTINIAGGQSHHLTANIKYGHNVMKSDFNGDLQAARRTMAVFVIFRPMNVTSVEDVANTSLAPVRVNWFTTEKYKYRIPTVVNYQQNDYTKSFATAGTGLAVAQGGSVFTTTIG